MPSLTICNVIVIITLQQNVLEMGLKKTRGLCYVVSRCVTLYRHSRVWCVTTVIISVPYLGIFQAYSNS
jgi:hypothetical protein